MSGAQLTVCAVSPQSREGQDAGMPLWFVEGSYDSADPYSRDMNYLVCRGQRRFPIPSRGHVDCPGGDIQRDLVWRGVANAYQSSAALHSTVGSSGFYASYSHIVWVSSAHRSDASEMDPHYTTDIKQDILSFASYLYQLISASSAVPVAKQLLFADVLTDASGSIARDFPKAQDGTTTTCPQRIVNLKHLESLFGIVLKRKAQNKGPRATSIVVLTPVAFDLLDWMTGDASAPAPPPLLMLVFTPATSSASHAASAAYTHATLLNAVRPLPTAPTLLDRIHARGGVSSLCVYLAQSTRYVCDALVYVAQQYEESEGTAVPLSNLALVDMLLSQLSPEESASTANDLEVALASARLRITKLETLLNLKSNAPSDLALFTKLSDALFEVDVQREVRLAAELHVDHLQKQLALLQKDVAKEVAVPVVPNDAIVNASSDVPIALTPVEDTSGANHPAVIESNSQEQQTTPVATAHPARSSRCTRCLQTWSSLNPSATDAPSRVDDSSSESSSSSSDDTTSSDSSSSGASLTLDAFVAQAREDRRLRALQKSFDCGLSIGDVDDDLVSASDAIGPGSSTRVIKWGAHAQGSRREKWRRMYRSMQRALRSCGNNETVVPVADVLEFVGAAFDCAIPRHSDMLNRVAHLHRHHLPSTLSFKTSGSTSSDSEDVDDLGVERRFAPWVNTRVALSALWNPCRDDIPKVTSILIQKEPALWRVGMIVSVVVVLSGCGSLSAGAQNHNTAGHPFSSRVRWYRSYPTETNPATLHCVKEEQRGQSSFRCEYRTTTDDIGSILWCEVVPRDTRSGRWGAAASVSTTTTISQAFQPPQLLHVRLLNNTRKQEVPVGEFVFVGDTVSVAYEIVSWPLEGRSRIRWLVGSSLARVSQKRTLAVTHTPHRSIVIPASCAYQLLQVELIPVQANGSKAGPMVTSLAVMVLPRPQTVHLLEMRISGPSAWSHTWRKLPGSNSDQAAPMAVLPIPLALEAVSSGDIHQVFLDIATQIETAVDISLGSASETADATQTDLVVAIGTWIEQAFAASETVNSLARSVCGVSIHHTTGIQFEMTTSACGNTCWEPVPWDEVDAAENVSFPFTAGAHTLYRRPLAHLVVVLLRSPLAAASDATPGAELWSTTATSVLVAFESATTAELFVLIVNLFRSLFQSRDRVSTTDGATVEPQMHAVKPIVRLAAANGEPLVLSSDSAVAALVDTASSSWLSLWMAGAPIPLSIEVKKSLKSIIFPLLATSDS